MSTVTMLANVRSATRSIGAILMDAGMLSAEDAERILRLQKEEHLRFGDAAIKLGLLTEADIRYALSRQFDYAYLPPSSYKPVSEELVAAYQPFSPQVEQLRAIRSQLMLRWFDKVERRTALTIVGADRGEGRSYLAANLAVVFSQLGERTLLIDADLRNPRQHELFKLENRAGLSSVMAGRAGEAAIVPIPDFAGLAVLPAGPTPPNPLELVGRHAFDELLEHAGRTYDVVLIDTPAFCEGADAVMVAVHTGAALAVARKNQTHVGAYRNLVAELTNSGIAVVGSVLNDTLLAKTAR